MKTQAFTLLELLISLLLVAILLMLSQPAWRDIGQQYREDTSMQHILADLRFARSMALLRGQSVLLCPFVVKEQRCDTRFKHVWDAPWAIAVQEGATLITLALLPPPPHYRVYWRGFPQHHYPSFNALGLMDANNGHFLLCPIQPADKIQAIFVAKSGRARISTNREAASLRCPDTVYSSLNN